MSNNNLKYSNEQKQDTGNIKEKISKDPITIKSVNLNKVFSHIAAKNPTTKKGCFF